MKRELNVDNVVHIINQQGTYIFPSNNLQMYKKYLQNIMDYFYDDFINEEFEKCTMMLGSFCNGNENLLEKELYDINLIEFVNYYPSITVKLYKKGELKFSSPEFAQLYEFLYLNKYIIFKHPDSDKNTQDIVRFILNYLFGYSVSKYYNGFVIDKPELVSQYAREINQEILISHNPIYIDTDRIYIEKISDDLKNYLDSFELPYKVTENINALFLKPKKYIVENNGIIKEMGVFSTRTKRYPHYEEQINDFKRNLKIRSRTKKIEKILSRGNR